MAYQVFSSTCDRYLYIYKKNGPLKLLFEPGTRELLSL